MKTIRMKKEIVVSIIFLFISVSVAPSINYNTASASASALIIPTNHSSSIQKNSTKAIFRFHTVKLIMRVTSGLEEGIWSFGYTIQIPFRKIPLYIGAGIYFLSQFKVNPGPVTLQPLFHDPIVLNSKDSFSFIFGTFHFWEYHQSESILKGLVVGRFYGVTVEITQ
jgi:hypothetical protein